MKPKPSSPPRTIWKSADNTHAVEELDNELFFVWRAPLAKVFSFLPNPLEYDMTKRESQVFTQILCGLHDKEIADLLKISVRTVKFHATSIYQKMGITGRRALFAFQKDKNNGQDDRSRSDSSAASVEEARLPDVEVHGSGRDHDDAAAPAR